MIYRILIFSFQLFLLLIILTFIFTNPFIISLDIGNLKYSFSSNLLSVLLIVFLLFFYLILYIFFKTRFSLNKFVLVNKYKNLEKGYYHFIEAMIAVANKDNNRAIKSHRKMNKFLKDDPSLSLLLNKVFVLSHLK